MTTLSEHSVSNHRQEKEKKLKVYLVLKRALEIAIQAWLTKGKLKKESCQKNSQSNLLSKTFCFSSELRKKLLVVHFSKRRKSDYRNIHLFFSSYNFLNIKSRKSAENV